MPVRTPRPASSPRPVLDSLLDDARLARVIGRAQWFDRLDARLREHLPPVLAAHARLASVDGDRLVYLVDSPVWHARLRLSSAPVLAAARALGLEVSALAIRVARAPFDLGIRHVAAMDASARRRAGTTAAEGRALGAMRELLGEAAGGT